MTIPVFNWSLEERIYASLQERANYTDVNYFVAVDVEHSCLMHTQNTDNTISRLEIGC